MTIRVRIASTAQELDALFRLRHQVYVEEEGYFSARPDSRIADRFDPYPTTANLVAVIDGSVVGTVRMAEQSDAGNPTDEFFDFRGHLPEDDAKVCSGSMLCVARAYRDAPRLVFSLLGMAYFWAGSRGARFVTGVVNPDVAAFFAKAGARPVAEPVLHPHLGLTGIPVVIDLDRLPGGFPAFLDRQRTASPPETYEREFLEQGQILSLRAGGRVTYVVLGGRVAVERRTARESAPTRVAVLNRGQSWSERMLPADPAATTIVALSQADLMVAG
jgi:N-acyl-L-homoserine lactone synthetase